MKQWDFKFRVGFQGKVYYPPDFRLKFGNGIQVIIFGIPRKSRECIIMEWSGTYDEDGTEIYVGDILEFDKHEWWRHSWLSKEEFDAKPSALSVVERGESGEFEANGNYGEWKSYCKVVGNIIENPEMIEPL